MKKRMRSLSTKPEGQNSSNREFIFISEERAPTCYGIPHSVLDYKVFIENIDLIVIVQKGKCDLVQEKGRQINHIIQVYGVNIIIS